MPDKWSNGDKKAASQTYHPLPNAREVIYQQIYTRGHLTLDALRIIIDTKPVSLCPAQRKRNGFFVLFISGGSNVFLFPCSKMETWSMKFGLSKFFTLVVVAFLSSLSANASAQYIEDFTTNQTVLFEFGAYAGNTSFNADGLQVAIPASADSFGGVGVAPIGTVDITGVTALEVTARLDAGNASNLILSIREQGVGGALGEFFSYEIPASSFTPGEFVTVSVDPTVIGFNGDITDGVLNGLLDNTGIQSPFGGTGAQNFTVSSVNFVTPPAIPEPSAVVVLAGLGSLVALRRRRA